jgi:hypothetical protein
MKTYLLLLIASLLMGCETNVPTKHSGITIDGETWYGETIAEILDEVIGYH